MSVAEPVSSPAGTGLVPADTVERRWRRRSLWALLIVLPVTFLVMADQSLLDLWRNRELFERVVPFGSETRFAGGDWRLETIGVLPRSDRKEQSGPAAAIRLRFAVTIRESGIENLWQECRISLVGGEGQRWAASGFGGPPSSEGAVTCSGATLDPPAPGTVIRIEQDFIVPRGVAGIVEPTVSMAGTRPWYLRFRRGG